jgi:HK97 family phage prohead protease
MEYKVLVPELKMADDDGPGAFSGYASTFENWDSVKERPVRGAFEPHLSSFLQDGFIAIGHDWKQLPAATLTEAYEDDHGLFISGVFHSTPEAQNARTVIKERLERGKSVKLSIGYEVLKDEYVEGGRLLKEVKLFETSFVNVPANPLAAITGAKGLPVAGQPIEMHSEAAVSVVEELKRCVGDKIDARTKEGRALSAARATLLRESVTAMMGNLQAIVEMLDAAEPRDPEESAKLFRLHMERQARLRALGVKTA